MRREDTAFRAQQRHGVDGAVLSARAFALRFFTEDHRDDRLLIVNLGRDLTRPSFAEPLLAPPAADLDWTIRWSSEDPAYGGRGTPRSGAKDYADRATSRSGSGGSLLLRWRKRDRAPSRVRASRLNDRDQTGRRSP